MKKLLIKNFNIRNHTTIKVGGITEYFAEPNNIYEFLDLLEWSHLNNQKCLIIGAGSNLLINNIFLKGLIICTKKMKTLKIEPETGIVEAEAGVMLPTLSTSLAKYGLQGGEWAVGIPGTLGGAICMNAGTRDISLANNLISVKVINSKTLEIFELKKKEINFGYRFSPFQDNDLMIISAKMHFIPKGNISNIIQTTKDILKKKKESQPYHLPSFGSIFKNPDNNFAAKLIDDTGLKGLKIGGAEISNMHANFIVNNSSASSKDIFKLITLVQKKVQQNKGIFLQLEVRMIGFDYPK